MGIGGNIRELRLREGLSQAQFAQMVGVTKETVSRWEHDAVLVRASNLKRMMELFGVVSDDILSEHIGLEAQARFRSDRQPVDAGAVTPASPVPVYKIVRSPAATTVQTASWAYAPPDVVQRHPHAIFFQLEGNDIARTAPAGSHVLVDPDIKPWNGSLVLALMDNTKILCRRFSQGNSMAILSTYAYEDGEPDLVVDRRRVRIMGVIVWHQASHDLPGRG